MNERFARRKARFSEIEILSLAEHQIYPPPDQLTAAHTLPPQRKMIDRQTPIASMGSCFARAIKNHLQAHGYNYLQCGQGPELEHGSALWERVYSTACIRQEIERGFGLFSPDILTFPDGRAIDPHRKHKGKGRIQASHDAAVQSCDAAARAANEALTQARVFIVTLGLSEVWYDKVTGKTFAEPIPSQIFDESRHGFRILSPQENVDNLESAFDLFHQKNPESQVILTVSPIPLRATFIDRGVVVSNCVSKASLIWTAHEISQSRDWVHYFPSYEIVTTQMNAPYTWDARHVTDEAAAHIMEKFESVFVV